MNKSKIYAGIALVLMVGFVFGFFKLLAMRNEAPKAAQQEKISLVDTSTWKTYRNEQYGFEFKHPVFLLVDVDENDDAYVALKRSTSTEEQPVLSFDVEKNPQDLAVAKYFSAYFDGSGTPLGSAEDVIIGGRAAVIINPIATFAGGEVIVIPLAGNFLVIHDNGGSFRADGSLDQILSTLKFIK